VSRKLVVFDFDHTLYDGDSGGHLVGWLIRRSAWRSLAAILAAPILLPLVAFLPTRRFGISGFLWIGTLGTHARHDLDALIDQYVTHDAATSARACCPRRWPCCNGIAMPATTCWWPPARRRNSRAPSWISSPTRICR
jgi:phosphoserine phosphatase